MSGRPYGFGLHRDRWPERQLLRLRELWNNTDMSARQIAPLISREFPAEPRRSHNAVIGKARRDPCCRGKPERVVAR